MLKVLGKQFNRHEIAWTCVNPSIISEVEAASGDDAMSVGMMGEILCPGVQHQYKTRRGTEMPMILGKVEQGLGTGMEK